MLTCWMTKSKRSAGCILASTFWAFIMISRKRLSRLVAVVSPQMTGTML